jgi:two-component system, LytTR family, response regulator
MIRSVVVEDDPKYSDRLVQLLKKIGDQVEVLAVCRSVSDAQKAITELHPELVFLDIELGNETGFDLLKKTSKISFDVIFTTSHIDNNIRAIRACAISYLPKPIIPDELADAIKKYREKNGKMTGSEQVSALKTNLQAERSEDKIIWINKDSDYFPVEVKNIIYCVSNNQYTSFFIKTDQKELTNWVSTKGIGEWENDLEQFRFCRIHNRYLVNLKHVVKYTKGDGGSVTLSTGDSLDVSKERKQKFLTLSGMK